MQLAGHFVAGFGTSSRDNPDHGNESNISQCQRRVEVGKWHGKRVESKTEEVFALDGGIQWLKRS